MFTLWLHNNATRPVINHAVSAFLQLLHTHSNSGELQSSKLGKDFSPRKDGSARWVIWPRQIYGATQKWDARHGPAILDGFGFRGHKENKASFID